MNHDTMYETNMLKIGKFCDELGTNFSFNDIRCQKIENMI